MPGLRSYMLLLPAVICSFAAPAAAQDDANFPSRPIKLIVPTPAGAGVDTAARITAGAVEKHLGQPLVIENRPGASFRIGTALVAKAPPDGYTLLFTAPTPIAVLEHFTQKLEFNPAADLRPVVLGVYQPVLLIVRPKLGVKSVAEFIALAKANPSKIVFGIQGLGGEMHLQMKHFEKTAGISFTQLPYTGGTQAIVDLLGDRLDAMYLVIPPIRDYVENGSLLALATTNATRVTTLPAIPTMAELGRPELTNNLWFGYFAPAGVSDAIIKKLASAFARLQSDSALVKRVADLGAELKILGPTEFGTIIAEDRARYGKIVAEGNLAKSP